MIPAPKKTKKPQDERLETEQRIRKEWVFKFVFDHGKFAKGNFFHLWAYADKEEKFIGKGPKIGLVVGRKTHNRANVRNLWKRRMREVFRKNQIRIKPETLILLQSRSAKKVPKLHEMQKEFEKLLEKTGSAQ